VAAHIAESRAEWELVTQGEGAFADAWRARGIPVAPRARSCIALLEATGLLATRPLLIHCVHLTSDDSAVIALRGCSLAHCPASNAKLAHGIAPLRSLMGVVPVGLGSDSVASNNRMDILDEARLAVLMARSARHEDLNAERVLELATIGGARALGLEREIGSLEPGKAADLAAFRVDASRDEPIYHPATALVFGSGGRRAQMVAVAGVELVRDGRLLANWAPDIAAVREIGERLARFALEAGVPGGLDFTVESRVGTTSPRGDIQR
jgi:5-methylthioadenosine/S-adenosylhomocysteine deaminase